PGAHARAPTATHLQWFGQAAHVHPVSEVRPLLHSLDELEVHNGRPVDPDEALLWQSVDPLAERLANPGMLAIREMQGRAVLVGEDGDDLTDAEKGHPLVHPEEQPILARQSLVPRRFGVRRL